MAETYAAHKCAKEVIWARDFLKEIRIPAKGPTVVKADNKAMIGQTINPINHAQSKHYRIAQHFIRELVKDSVIKFEYAETESNEADMNTKALGLSLFLSHRAMIMGPQRIDD